VRIWALVLYSIRGWPNAIRGVSSQCALPFRLPGVGPESAG
jgi:hypothetical protein